MSDYKIDFQRFYDKDPRFVPFVLDDLAYLYAFCRKEAVWHNLAEIIKRAAREWRYEVAKWDIE